MNEKIAYDNQGRKRCAKCREYKWLREFHNAKHTRDGKSGYCIDCMKIAAEQWRRKKGMVKGGQGRSKIPRKCRVSQPQTIEEKRHRLMEYGWIPKGSITRRCNDCKQLKVEEVIDSKGICAVCNRKKPKTFNKRGRPRKYKYRNESGRRREFCKTEIYRANVKAAKQRRRTREKNGSFTGKEWLTVKQKYNNTCLCCGKQEPEITLTADHIKPLAVGGTNTIDNIQPLCMECNTKKGIKEIDYRELYVFEYCS